MTLARSITLIALSLTIFGLIMVGSASIVGASRDFGDKWFYLKQQSVWALIGWIGFWVASSINHHYWQKLALPMFVGTVFLLVVVLIPGVGTSLMGARRWLIMGFFNLQPSEVAKITVSVYLSSLLAKADRFPQFLFTLGLVGGLIMLEPDMGTTLVIMGMGVAVYFGSGGKIRNLLALFLLGAVGMSMLIAIAPYRLNRIKSFMDSSSDPLGSSYQIRQALIALGSGGVFGQGLGQSRQKYDFLPESTTDSIYAIVGEELGLAGTLLVLGVFYLLINKGLIVSKLARTQFSSNLALALTAVLGLQALINISAITSLFPLTGIPLTYISYGGSSLVMMLASTGILVNIAKNHA